MNAGGEQASAPSRRGLTPSMLLVATLVIAVTTAAAVAASLRQQRLYGGVADVFVSTQSASTDGEAQRVLDTQRLISTSDRVLGPIAAAQRIPLSRLQSRVTVSQVGNSGILRITAGDPDRATARRLAQAVADTYVENRLKSPPADTSVEANLQTRIEELSRDLRDVDARVATLQADRGSAPPGLEENQLQIQASRLVRDISTLQDRLLAEALRPGVPDDVRVVAPARLLEEPLEPQPVRAGAEGLLVGCVIASGLVALLLLRAEHRPPGQQGWVVPGRPSGGVRTPRMPDGDRLPIPAADPPEGARQPGGGDSPASGAPDDHP